MNSDAIHQRVRERTRRAYELGRLRLGAIPVLIVGAMVGISISMSHDLSLSIPVGAILGVLVVVFSAQGRTYGRSVMPGLLAGTAPLALPIVLRSWGHCCINGSCYSLCLLGCVSGGLAAGFALGKLARRESHPYHFLASASILTGGAGLLGCTMAGGAGMAGMALAMAVSSLPILVFAPRVSNT